MQRGGGGGVGRRRGGEKNGYYLERRRPFETTTARRRRRTPFNVYKAHNSTRAPILITNRPTYTGTLTAGPFDLILFCLFLRLLLIGKTSVDTHSLVQ